MHYIGWYLVHYSLHSYVLGQSISLQQLRHPLKTTLVSDTHDLFGNEWVTCLCELAVNYSHVLWVLDFQYHCVKNELHRLQAESTIMPYETWRTQACTRPQYMPKLTLVKGKRLKRRQVQCNIECNIGDGSIAPQHHKLGTPTLELQLKEQVRHLHQDIRYNLYIDALIYAYW